VGIARSVCLAIGTLIALSSVATAAETDSKQSPFQPRDARVWDSGDRKFVWRDGCGNDLEDHRLGGGFEWEGDNRNYIALSEASVRGQRRGGLVMLAFPDGNVLNAAWKVNYAKGETFRIQYALTDGAADKSSNGLKFTMTATDQAGKPHTLIDRVLKPGDQQIYDESVRLDYPVKEITFTHDNLGQEAWDTLWINPQGLVVPKPLRPSQPQVAKVVVPAVTPESQIASLRQAIQDLCDTFGDRYPRGKQFLARLDRLVTGTAPPAFVTEMETLRREALVANPLVSGQPILFEARAQHVAIYHAIDTLYQVGEATEGKYHRGGALKTLDLAAGKVTTLIDAPKGTVRSPCVSFDGKKLLFSMRRDEKENLHLFVMNADGSGLKQLTFAAGVSDFDPLYLPDGGIAFSSTRDLKFNMCSQDLGANLFRMEPDGANITQITANTLFDNQGALLPDGRILYSRWEYVDRNFGDAHGVWAVRPDGTNQSLIWGNNKASPAAVYYAQAIPGSRQLLAILSMHHYNMWGALAIIDPGIDTDAKRCIVRTWPPEAINWIHESDRFDCDGLNALRPKYETPFPLSAKHFLCSRMTGNGDQMGIYLVDVFGNEVLLHAEAPSCFAPMPLRPRPIPPVIPARRDYESGDGFLFVLNVYEGTHMRGVRPGSVRSLRIIESIVKRSWTPGKWYGQGFQAPGMNWHDFTAKQILGTVPVEADGSAYFSVPAGKFLCFQLLDENDMMIQSMRSGCVVQPGESTGCVGCHDNRLAAPPVSKGWAAPMALRRAPSQVNGWYGPPRPFSYLAEVQPVFDKHCVRCHDFGKDGAKKLILAGDKDPFFNASYTQLWRKGYVKAIGAGPASVQQAYSWGSHASRLTQDVMKRYRDGSLDKESFDRVVTWIDINAPYYPSYDSAYPNNPGGRCPIDGGKLSRLATLTGVKLDREDSFDRSTGPHVSFDRPELSPCLAKLDKTSPQYAEALSIIQAGKEMLAKRPRADMPGFQPCERDRQREAFAVQRIQIERRVREAIRKGERAYDEGAPLAAGKDKR